MKKRVSVITAIALCTLCLSACGNANKEVTDQLSDAATVETATEETADMNTPLSGGWSVAENSEITDELNEVFNKATETLTGAEYTPVAYLGSQVVAGTNHAFLCRSDSSVKELQGNPELVIVYVYQDLSGNCEILQSAPLALGVS